MLFGGGEDRGEFLPESAIAEEGGHAGGVSICSVGVGVGTNTSAWGKRILAP